MAVVAELIRKEEDGSISFGNYQLNEKSKLSDFEHGGDLYKVKTFYEITKLEKNGMFIYESVPGTSVSHFSLTEEEVQFQVMGDKDAQLTLELEPTKKYSIILDGTNIGEMNTNLGGKLSFCTELEGKDKVEVRVVKCELA